jgi:hypothetical protein
MAERPCHDDRGRGARPQEGRRAVVREMSTD